MAKETWVNLLEQFRRSVDVVRAELGKVVIGQQSVLDQMLAAIFSRGHCLLVGVPGLAKTLMVSTLARVMALSFKRIQFTPDLMPSDITGTSVIEESGPGGVGRRSFRFVHGPMFANIVLADEINLTPPKTQAALLQSMQEREVTVGQETHPLPDPFFVIATQNPIEQEGTYPLPEAQLDRFMFNVYVDYPSLDEEQTIIARSTGGQPSGLQIVLNATQILNMQKVVSHVPVAEFVVQYVARLVRATRPTDDTAPDFVRKLVDWGAGPRAGQHLLLGAKAFAAMRGRLNVSLDDVRKVAVPVLRHRIGCNFSAQAEGVDTVAIVRRLLSEVREPEPPKYGGGEPAPPEVGDW
jgi:MoxR-like ATPase